MKYILILIMILSCSLQATTMEDQNKWQVMKSSPLKERPFALHNMLNWVEPTVIDLPPSTFSVRKFLIGGIVYHYNTYTKPHVDLKLMLCYSLQGNEMSYSLQGNEMFDIHNYMFHDLKRYVESFMYDPEYNHPTLIKSRLIIESNGKYRFEDDC